MWNPDGDLTVTWKNDESQIFANLSTHNDLSVSLVDNEATHVPPNINASINNGNNDTTTNTTHDAHANSPPPRPTRKRHLLTILLVWLFSLLLSLPSHTSKMVILFVAPMGILASFMVPGMLYLRLGPVDEDFGQGAVCCLRGEMVPNWVKAWIAIVVGVTGVGVDIFSIVKELKE